MSKRRLLFIYNPKAGRSRILRKLPHILDIFAKSGFEMTVVPTQKSTDAYRAVAERSGAYELLVCGGGDGTLEEVISAMIQNNINLPLGYLPAGSTNDFGRSIKLPKDLLRAALICTKGQDFLCDVGRMNDDVFVYIAAFGLFTDVSYETGQDMKNILGHLAYLLEGAKRLPSIRSYTVKITTPDGVIEDDFIYGMVTNSLSVGGFSHITGKKVLLDDGLFEMTFLKRPQNPLELNRLIHSLLNRDFDTNMMISFKAAQVDIISEELIPWTVDGEYGGSHTAVHIENLHKAIRIRVGSKDLLSF
ncbi:MAG: YegS/Rv2252/BmrU family lipid kinase [Clostridium sp.]|jgi:YegS/Rv2252/BmrU family lipid kinase|nr:YegS/Rv2252/BmrU family lipid kinase [Clostridium sp.]